jgi:hypothetical protein
MNQGMVASVIGIFANTSAHTSYLFLVKDRTFRQPHFATAPAQKTRDETHSARHDVDF